MIDIAVALCALIAFAPLFGAVALLIALDDGRPILFRQVRVGRRGKLFFILKFRTMSAHASGSSLTAAGDRRVTRAGRWLRKLKLDELPQFVNVLRGEMSLIGPRPEVPEYVQIDHSLWQAVLAVRPGITDLASLAYRNEEEILGPVADPEAYYRKHILPAKLKLNLQYLESRSLLSDLRLLWLTARFSFLPRGFNTERVIASMRGRQH